jgi:hypothetical protein
LAKTINSRSDGIEACRQNEGKLHPEQKVGWDNRAATLTTLRNTNNEYVVANLPARVTALEEGFRALPFAVASS